MFTLIFLLDSISRQKLSHAVSNNPLRQHGIASRGKRGLVPSRAPMAIVKPPTREVPIPFCHGLTDRPGHEADAGESAARTARCGGKNTQLAMIATKKAIYSPVNTAGGPW